MKQHPKIRILPMLSSTQPPPATMAEETPVLPSKDLNGNFKLILDEIGSFGLGNMGLGDIDSALHLHGDLLNTRTGRSPLSAKFRPTIQQTDIMTYTCALRLVYFASSSIRPGLACLYFTCKFNGAKVHV